MPRRERPGPADSESWFDALTTEPTDPRAPEPTDPRRTDDPRRTGTTPTDDDPMDADEALDREFGLDPRVVARRTPGQVVRNVLLTLGITAVAAGLIVGALSMTLQSVQDGVGGLFPQPAATLGRFETTARALPGVTAASDLDQRQTEIFTGYDVTALVTADPALSPTDQQTLIGALSRAAATSTDRGVRVYAQLQLGTVRVGVSPARRLSDTRLTVGQQIGATPGVTAVELGWRTPASGSIVDSSSTQQVRVTTSVPADQVAALTTTVTAAAHQAMPDAQVVVVPAGQ